MRVILLLTVLIAALAFSFWQWPAPADSPPAHADPSLLAATPVAPDAGTETHGVPIARKVTPAPTPTPVAAVEVAERVPLPPLSMPLGDALAALEANASAGDVQARIRLYHQSRCCKDMDSVSGMIAASRTQALPDYFRAQIPELESYLLALDALCGKVPRFTAAQLQRYQSWARDAGDPVALIEFASGMPINVMPMETGSFDEQIQRLQARRDGALPALQRALEGGSLDAVSMLASLHATPRLHRELGSLVEQSWQTTAIYNFLYLRAGGQAFRQQYENFVAIMPRRLKPAELALAQQQAEALYQRHFAGKPVTEFAPGLVPGLSPGADFQPSSALPGLAHCPVRPTIRPPSPTTPAPPRPSPR